MRYKTHLTLLIVVIVSLPTGCFFSKSDSNQLTPINWDDLQVTPRADGSLCWDVSLVGGKPLWDDIKRDFRYGLAMGLDIFGAREIGYLTYEAETEQSLKADFHLWYPEENTEQAIIRFFVLLDEKQLTNVFTSSQYYEDVTIPVGSEITISLNLPPLSPDIHDLIIIGIPYPSNYPNPEGIVRVLGHRATIVAGLPSSPFRQIYFVSLPTQGSLVDGEPKISLLLTLTEDKLKVWNWPSSWLDTGVDNIKFFIWAGHNDVLNEDAPHLNELEFSSFALLLFKDYKQVEIVPGQTVVYGKVNKNTAYTRIPTELTSLSSGKHHVLVLRIDSPGVPMCILQGPPRERILPFDVTGTLVGINVLYTNNK